MAFFNLPFSPRISNENPIDGDRYIAADIAQRDALITNGRAHLGLQVYVLTEKKLYILETLSPDFWALAGGGKELIAGNGITLSETTSSIEIATTVGTAQIDRFTAVGGETTASLSYELDTNYKYQVFMNGVLQQEGAGSDYTLTLPTGSASTVNFEVPLLQLDYVDIYYNTSLPEEPSGLVESDEKDQKKCSVERGDVFFTRTSETIDDIAFYTET